MKQLVSRILALVVILAMLLPMCAVSEGTTDAQVEAIPEEVVETSVEEIPAEPTESAEEVKEPPTGEVSEEPEALPAEEASETDAAAEAVPTEEALTEEIPVEEVLPPIYALLDELGMEMEALAELTGYTVEELEAMSENEVAELYLAINDGAYAADALDNVAVIASGDCGASGSNVKWTIYSDGRLVISGTGRMKDFEDDPAPWDEVYDADITAVDIEYGVTSIGRDAFHYYDITSIFIPNSVTSIGYWSFVELYSLKSITIPSSVTDIENLAFEYCGGLKSINVDSGNKYYSSKDGVLFDKNKKTLIYYPEGKTTKEYSIPDSVTKIGMSAFSANDSLTSVTIPNSVTSIENSAFSECWNMERVTMPNSVIDIGEFAFCDCESLKSITIPKNVTYIGEYTFSGCVSLKSVTIPDGVTYIGEEAFSYCFDLKSIAIPRSVTYIDDYAFDGCEDLTIGVFSGSYAEQYCIKNKLKYTILSPVKPTGVKLDQSGTVKLNMGTTLQLHATLQPLNAAADSITWKSSATKYAKVDANGVVTPVAEGTATITVTAKRGSVKKTASVKIKVVDPYKPTGVKLDQTGTGLLSLGSTLRLKPSAQPATAIVDKYSWKSSSTKYAKVDANGVVTPVKEGTATITVTATRGKIKKTATVKVKVVDPYKPDSVKLDQTGTVKLNMGSTLRLNPSVQPATAIVDSYSWKSSATKYAKVDANGVVTPVAEGTATITVTAKHGSIKKTASVKVKVVDPYKPTGVSLNVSGTVTLQKGSTLQLKPIPQPSIARFDSYSWKSSNTKYATVDANGLVTPVKAGGTTTITVTAKRGSVKKTASVKVKVESPVTYRALLIGQEGFSPICTRNRGAVNYFNKALKTVKGGEGNKFSITTKIDRTKSQVQSDIRTAFAGADNDDVSLFFYASHGVVDKGYYYGAVSTYNGEYILTEELTNWLKAIPGKVIVICGSCGSGALIQNGEGDAAEAFDPDAFNRAFIKAFAEADPGIVVEGDGMYENSAEMRQSKFCVLTASAAGELSWGLEYDDPNKDGYTYFAKWLSDGIGTSGKMPADSNKDGAATLNELYKYVHQKESKKTFKTKEGTFKQHCQVYPENSSYVLFRR